MLRAMWQMLWFEARRRGGAIAIPIAILTVILAYFILLTPTPAPNPTYVIKAFTAWWTVVCGTISASMFLMSLRDDYNSRVWHGILTYPIPPAAYVLARGLLYMVALLVASLIPDAIMVLVWRIPAILLAYQLCATLTVVLAMLIVAPMFGYSFIVEAAVFLYFMLGLILPDNLLMPLLRLAEGKVDIKGIGIVLVLLALSTAAFMSEKWRYVS